MSTDHPGLEDLLREIKSLEPLPQVALRVLVLSGREDVIPREIVDVIQTDVGIVGKVLKLCNSAYFGFRREIASLEEAGNLLGTSTLTSLVLTSCAGRYFRDYGASSPELARKRWENSVAMAVASNLLAAVHGRVDRHRAYTAGLLGNVGHLVVDRFLPLHESDLRQQLQAGATRLEAEAAVLGLDHAEIGARLAERWNLPDVLVDTIRHHHVPEAARIAPELASVAHLGEMLATANETDDDLENLAYRLHERALSITGLDRPHLDTLSNSLRGELSKAREAVEVG